MDRSSLFVQLIEQRNTTVYECAAIIAALVLAWDFIVRFRGRQAASLLVASAPEQLASPSMAWMAIRGRWFWFVFGLAVVVRIAGVDFGPLWYDEATSVWIAGLPFSRMLAAVGGDVHPPLFYILLWLVAQIGGSDVFAMRLLPGLFSLAAFPLTKLVADHLKLSTGSQVVALLILTFSNFQILYASDVRMYSMLQALVLLAVLCVLKRRFTWLTLVMAAMMYTHNYGLIFSAAIGLLGLVNELRLPHRPSPDNPLPASAVRRLLMAGVWAGVLYLPWAFTLISQMRDVSANFWIWPASAADVLVLFFNLLFGGGPAGTAGALTFFASLALLALAAFKSLRYPMTFERGALLWLIVGPVLLAVAISVAWKPVFVSRYLLPITPFYALLLGWALTHGVGRRMRFVAALLLMPLFLIGAATPAHAQMLQRGQPQDIAHLINVEWREGDVILHTDIWTMVETRQFLGDKPNYLYPVPVRGLNGGGLSAQTRTAMGIAEARLDDLNWQRAWVIVAYSPTIYPRQRSAAVVDALVGRKHQLVDSWWDDHRLFGMEIYQVWPQKPE